MNIVCSCLYKVHFTKEKLATHRNALGSVSLKLLEKPGTDLAACTSSAHSDRGWDCFGVCFAAEMPALSPEAVCWEQVPSASGLSSAGCGWKRRQTRPAPTAPRAPWGAPEGRRWAACPVTRAAVDRKHCPSERRASVRGSRPARRTGSWGGARPRGPAALKRRAAFRPQPGQPGRAHFAGVQLSLLF